MDRGTRRATVHGVTKCQTSSYIYIYIYVIYYTYANRKMCYYKWSHLCPSVGSIYIFTYTSMHSAIVANMILPIVLSHAQFFATPWITACQAPLSIKFSRQEYWSGLPFPSPGDLPNPGIKPMLPVLAGKFFTTKPPRKPIMGSESENESCSVVSNSVTLVMHYKDKQDFRQQE